MEINSTLSEMVNMEVFSDLSERVKYNLPGLPLYMRKNKSSDYTDYAALCHWHPDLEFCYLMEDSTNFFVNGRRFHLNKGEGIFVNSKRLHYNYSENKSNSTFFCLVINFALLGKEMQMSKEYIDEKFGFSTEDYVLLNSNNDWHREALMTINNIYDEAQNRLPNGTLNPLRLISHLTYLCACVGDNIQPAEQQDTDKNLLKAVWSMTGFIQKNYNYKITLNDIAAAGSVCRSKCCHLFNKYIGQTPIAYLTQYRINRSREMLKETNMSITEISMACGFQSPSYFSFAFQKDTGISPGIYRVQEKNFESSFRNT